LRLEENRLIINPGGVGQPRDGDPRASYAIYDSADSVIWHYRVPYEINITQQKMTEYGLPSRLITRLSYGW
ncbi:MAG: metallophosphoesterase, partial [Dehalococcoidia bacterium]